MSLPPLYLPIETDVRLYTQKLEPTDFEGLPVGTPIMCESKYIKHLKLLGRYESIIPSSSVFPGGGIKLSAKIPVKGNFGSLNRSFSEETFYKIPSGGERKRKRMATKRKKTSKRRKTNKNKRK